MTRYVAAFCAIALAIALAGRHVYIAERQEVGAEVRAQLEQIASVKAAQVSSWRLERIGDALTAEAGALLMPAVQDVVRGAADRAAKARVLALLDTFRANYQYASFSLLDAAGREVLTSGERLDSGRYRDLAREAAQASGVVLHETPGAAAGGHPRVTLAIALRHEDRDDHSPFGAIVLAVDPRNALSPPMVAKFDTGQAAASLAQTRRQILLIGGMLTLLCAISLAFIFYKQRYEAEAQRQALRGHYDYLTRYANDALVLMDGHGRLLEVNDRAVEMYGWTRDELLQMTVRDLRSDAARGQFDEQWEIILASGSLVFDTEHQRKNGRAFPVEISTRVVRVGALLFRQSTIRDITEPVRAKTALAEQDAQRRRAEEDLRVSRDRLERVLDAMDEGYFDRNLVTGKVHVSPRWFTMLGYLPGEVTLDWQAWAAMVHPDDRPSLEAASTKVEEAGGELFSFEFRLRCKSGQYIWVRSRGKTVERDAGGRPVRRIGTVSDITEHKKLEAQFLQAQKLESGGRLAGAVAHDFNNLLTIINGYSDLMLSQMDVGAPHQKHLQTVRDAGQRAAALTEQLLTFSRKQVVQPRVLGVNATIAEVENLLRRMAGEDVRIGLQLLASPDSVLADPSQLHQVLMNLVVNARDAMPEGGALAIETANVSVERDEAVDASPGPHVRLSVRDTGTGMPDETRALIFEPFFTTKERGKGTGLGLSTVYGIVRQSGGFIRVESEQGAGTTFHIYFPLAADAVVAAQPAKAAPRLVRGSETILVVENDEAVRALAVEALTSLGYDVLAAPDGVTALRRAALHRGTIDLLLADMSMPGMDGTTLAERVTAARPETKVLYMTGCARPADADYVAKPFTRRSLGAAVRAALGPAPQHEVSPRPVILVVDDDESVRTLVPEFLQDSCDVLVAADGAEAMDIVRRTPAIETMLTDLFMPKMEGFELIKEVRALRPGIRIVAMSGAFGGEFLAGAERAGVDATLRKPIQQETLRTFLTCSPPLEDRLLAQKGCDS